MSKISLVNARKSWINKRALSAIALILMMTVSTAAVFVPSVAAHDPPWTIPTYAYVTAAPSVWGLGSAQPVVIVIWLDIPPPTAQGNTGDRWRNFTTVITGPDGNVVYRNTKISDPIGSNYEVFTPTQTGKYTVDFYFPGQVLSREGPTGLNGSNSVYIGDYYQASNASTTFTVNNTPLEYFQEAPLPVSYWTRPINENNQGWYTIASAWLGSLGSGQGGEFGATYMKFNPNGRAPSTAHVSATIPLTFGGIVGGIGSQPNPINPAMSFYSGTQYQLKNPNPIIMYGNLYISLPQNNAPTGNGIACYDLRTGELKWKNENINSILVGQLYDMETPNQHGTTGNYLWATGAISGLGMVDPGAAAVEAIKDSYEPGTNLNAIASVRNTSKIVPPGTQGWIAIDAQTGKLLFNYTNVPSGTRALGPQGEWLIYSIGRANNNSPYTYLTQWNNTKLTGNDASGGITAWTPGVNNYNMSTAYDWNVTLSQPLNPTYTSIGSGTPNQTTGLYTNNPQILRVFPGNVIFGQSSGLQQTPGTSSGIFGTPDNFVLWAININASRGPIGQVLFEKTYQAPPGNLTVCIGPADGETNVFTLYYRETMQWTGYSMLTGDKLWGPVDTEGPAWNYYTGTTGLTNPIGLGYGNLYVAGYGGVLSAIDLKTGNIEFTYGNDPADPNNSTYTVETSYGTYPTQVAAIADGKVYLIQEEHSLNAPSYHGAMTRCVDAFTGELLWQMYGKSSWQEVAVADGYFVWFNLDDQQIYINGPGPSKTTVTTPDTSVPLGNAVMIKGTITDQTPLLKDTPAIADADQGPWMDYMVTHTRAMPNVNGCPSTTNCNRCKR